MLCHVVMVAVEKNLVIDLSVLCGKVPGEESVLISDSTRGVCGSLYVRGIVAVDVIVDGIADDDRARELDDDDKEDEHGGCGHDPFMWF